MRAVEGLRLDINSESVSTGSGSLTIAGLIEHYKRTELSESSNKSFRTKQVYGHQLDNVISPRWGKYRLREVKPVAVEAWLNGLPVAPGSGTKRRA